jgi:hypothetical protein
VLIVAVLKGRMLRYLPNNIYYPLLLGYTHKPQLNNDNISQKLKIFNLNVESNRTKRTDINVFYIRIREELQILLYEPPGHQDTGTPR